LSKHSCANSRPSRWRWITRWKGRSSSSATTVSSSQPQDHATGEPPVSQKPIPLIVSILEPNLVWHIFSPKPRCESTRFLLLGFAE
jgi:hypothetical protein